MKPPMRLDKMIAQFLRGGQTPEERARERAERAQAALRADAFRAAIRSLESATVARAAVAWLRDDWACDNVIWIPYGALAAEIQHYDDGKNVGAFAHAATRGLMHAAVPAEEGALARLFSRWGELAPDGEPTHPGESVRKSSEDGRADVLLSIASPEPGRESEVLGHLIWVGCREWHRISRDALFKAQIAAFADRMDQAMSHEAVRALTYKDELTDLYNQRYLPVVLEEQVERANKGEGRFSVLFIDVDRFKSVNDRNGHLVGSRILVELSRILRASVRRTDYAFRYGGDEYVIVLPGADAKGAFAAAERIRKRAEASSFALDPAERIPGAEGAELKVTVSIGVAAFPEHAQSTRDLLRIADEAMYASKRESRNAVRLAS